jgi:hypothetical protein
MGNLQGTSFGLYLKRYVIAVVMTWLLIPSIIQAEPLDLFCIAENRGPWPGIAQLPKKEVARRMFMEVDENGDFVIRHGNVSLILAYNTPDDDQRLPDYAHELQPRVCAAINGMSVKIGFMF